MLAAQTELKNAQKVKDYIIQRDILNKDYLAVKELGFIYFPLLKRVKVPGAMVVDTKFTFPLKQKELRVEELLKDKLTKMELKNIPKSQEVIGSILILEIPPEFSSKEKMIAQAYLQVHKAVSTVVKKEDIHSGQFRTRHVKILAGKKTTETIHQENGVKIKLDIEKVYFSARSAHERMRIAQQVKKNEMVLVMFSGAGPFLLVIARNSEVNMVYGVEMNPQGHIYAVENVTLNKLEKKIILKEGDVRQIVPLLEEKFDRIVMPLPKTGEEFLPLALAKVKMGGMIHLYAFLEEKDIKEYEKKVRGICTKLKFRVTIVDTVKCGQFSPRLFRMCLDIKILGNV